MCQLETFLGCFKLRTGCLFVGYMGAVTSFLGLIFSIGGVTVTTLRNDYFKGYEPYKSALMMWSAGFLVACSIIFVLSVILVVGVHKERPKLLKVYLISMTIYLSILFVAVMINTVVDAFGLRFLIIFAWNIYYMLVIRSYYFEIRDRQKGIQKI